MPKPDQLSPAARSLVECLKPYKGMKPAGGYTCGCGHYSNDEADHYEHIADKVRAAPQDFSKAKPYDPHEITDLGLTEKEMDDIQEAIDEGRREYVYILFDKASNVTHLPAGTYSSSMAAMEVNPTDDWSVLVGPDTDPRAWISVQQDGEGKVFIKRLVKYEVER